MAVNGTERRKGFSAIMQHYGQQCQSLNPFEEGNQFHDSFAVGYSGGYTAGMLVPTAGQIKAAQYATKLPYIAGLVSSIQAVKSSIKGAVLGSAMWTGGKTAQRIPVDWNSDFDPKKKVASLSDGAKQVVGKTADAFRDTPLATQQRVSELIGDLDFESRQTIVFASPQFDTSWNRVTTSSMSISSLSL